MVDPLAQWRADAEAVIATHGVSCYQNGHPCFTSIQARRVVALCDVVGKADDVEADEEEDANTWNRICYRDARAALTTEEGE